MENCQYLRTLGVLGNIAFLIAFGIGMTSNYWFSFKGGHMGIWNECIYPNDTVANASSSTTTVSYHDDDNDDEDENCTPLDIGAMECYLHITRALMVIAVLCYVSGYGKGANFVCEVSGGKKDMIKYGLISNIAAVFFGWWAVFSFEQNYEDDFDYEDEKLDTSFYVVKYVVYLTLITTFLLSWPLIVDKWPRFGSPGERCLSLLSKCRSGIQSRATDVASRFSANETPARTTSTNGNTRSRESVGPAELTSGEVEIESVSIGSGTSSTISRITSGRIDTTYDISSHSVDTTNLPSSVPVRDPAPRYEDLSPRTILSPPPTYDEAMDGSLVINLNTGEIEEVSYRPPPPPYSECA